MQASEGTLHNLALGAEPGAVLGAAAGDDRLHAEVPDTLAVRVVVVAADPEYNLWSAARSGALAAHGRYGLQKRDE